MIYRVIITQRAERDLRDAAHWWAENRSAEQAARWLDGFNSRLQTLAKQPSRCPLAAESAQFSFELRELHYGLGRRPTHRAVFTVAEDFVLVLAVRHAAQDHLRPDEL
jgi:plasmid stabilization system protein ParE